MEPEIIVNELLDTIRAIEDPVERFKAATKAVETARTTFMAGARQIRQDAVNELREDNSLAEISKLIGQSRSRVQQISEGRTGGKGRSAESDKPES
ncbi:MAG: hypothetical protein HOY79_17810 [Streptomyces sp.]|nr:hypothetical protein [Streptomyces sp.]